MQNLLNSSMTSANLNNKGKYIDSASKHKIVYFLKLLCPILK